MDEWRPGWPGFNARGSLLLPLPQASFAALPDTLEVDGIALARKREFHVTVFDRATGARLHAAPAAARTVAGQLPAWFAALDWSWRPTGERWLLREAKPEGVAHSVVELLDMPAHARLRTQAGEGLGEALPPTPPHVTLYVAGDPTGIGLASQAEFERLRLRRL